jgi:lipoprotein-anchoring transpeptidase ErfK/SrfK
VRRRTPLVLLILFLLLAPLVACGGKATTADATGDDSTVTEATTTPPDPWVTEVATATVPEVEVLTAKPLAAGGAIQPKGAAYSAAATAPIPRAGLNSAGVRKTDEGFAFENPTYFKNPLVFHVTEDAGDWLQVEVLARPNGQTGWIKRSDVTVSDIRTHMELDKATFHLKAFDGDQLVAETNVVIGKNSSYTPVGSFFLTEKISHPPAGSYGPWILATSAYSESLDSFDGGLPQVAFHGTNQPSLIGTQASNGCVRMPNDVDLVLADKMPPGTPITIA